jgi:NagD protein
MCRMITHATGVEPHAVLGKPNKRMLEGVMKRHGLRADELAVVGDRIYTDMAMARAAGATGILVLSGETTRQQAIEGAAAVDILVSDVGELGRLLSDELETKS